MTRLVTVAVPVPALDSLTYLAPTDLSIPRGARVVVPLGRRLMTGLVVDVREATERDDGAPPENLRDVARVLDPGPFLPPAIVDLALWVADYYLCTAGEALAAAMPPLAWVESEARWAITPSGRAAARGRQRVEERQILEALEEGRPADAGTLLRALSDALPVEDRAGRDVLRRRLDRSLRVLERAALVVRQEHVVGRADASKTERMVTPIGPPSATARLTGRQRDALDAIAETLALHGAATTAALAGQGVTAAVLLALERKGIVAFATRRVDRAEAATGLAEAEISPHAPEVDRLEPTRDQTAALRDLVTRADAGTFGVALLHGVTGSGKTEVYRRLARHVGAQGRQALILVPEIALTPAIAARFRAEFGSRVAIQHSALSEGERYDQWHRIRRGEVDVVVGTRSAVFAPLERLGLVVVDEEHDTSYKQEETPRYHGRDAALVRAKQAGAFALLGSATPSLESYQHALNGRYALISLPRRVLDRPLAAVHVVNMRDEIAEAGPDVILSARLRAALAARLAEGEQAILLLNRRGFATNVFCRQCGDTLDCPNCSVSLTVHRRAGQARCHYCDHACRLPEACAKCGGVYLEYQGVGTERVEGEVREAFPRARVARVDRDTVRRRGAITRVLRAFGRHEIDVLVGTQMIAKGHDFPAVTLVGVISADVGLGLADFRAGERTFQLLTQVAGRAGRGERPGEALIQTLVPTHYSIELAQTQDYAAFFARERHFRESLRYPPAVWLTNIVVRGRSESEARRQAALLADALHEKPGFRVLGPAPAPLARLRGHHRVQLFLKGRHRLAMRQAIRDALRAHPQLVRAVSIDVDPLTVL
jgi:primosomal protein N' (replication factor Y)